MTQPNLDKVSYGGWPNCYRLSYGDIELIVTTDVGPRIIRFAFTGKPNMFAEFPDQLGRSGEPWWMPRGGHRLWIAPEIRPDTYALDNAPLTVSINGPELHVVQPVEPETSLEKAIRTCFTIDGSVSVTHTVTNRGFRARHLAPWALTQFAPGGTGFVRHPPRGCHDDCLQPTHPLVMWAYTDFSDKRWRLNHTHLVLKQDPNDHSPQKAGIFCEHVLAGYLLGEYLFIKRHHANTALAYPDFHCSFEMFTNGDFLELETLGPLVDLDPGDSVSHEETWSLYRGCQLTTFSDQELQSLQNKICRPDD